MLPDPDPPRTAARAARHTRRNALQPDSECALCGTTNPVALKRSRLENHHAAGQHNDDDLLVVLCLNCHAIATENQHVVDAIRTRPDDTIIDRVRRGLLSIAAFLSQLVDTLVEFASLLDLFCDQLDSRVPTWRLELQ